MEVNDSTTDSVLETVAVNITRSYVQPGFTDIEVVDVNWILNAAFVIFTMQTGFGFLESGCVSVKNEAHILMKNLADITLGGFTYWMVGYGLSFGKSPEYLSNSFVALGSFFIDPSVEDLSMGAIFASFIFQLSFATTASTIISGAMAERCNYKAYCLFCFINVVTYCVSAGWVWGDHGFLNKMGVVDIAGSGPVHLVGGSAAVAAAFMLGPRLGRYGKGKEAPAPKNPVNAAVGTFLLWWGWLAFNSGSTYGTSGGKWPFAARAAVTTMMGSFGGGIMALIFSMIKRKGKADIVELMNGVLGSLVSITAGCFLYRTWEAVVIGAIGSLIVCLAMPLFDLVKLDDPVGASSVHGCAGIWGVLAVGLFADNPIPLDTTRGYSGLFKGGGWHLLGVQALAALCLSVWGFVATTVVLWVVDKIVPIRMDPYDELLGADYTQHDIKHGEAGLLQAIESLKPTENYKGKSEETIIEEFLSISREALRRSQEISNGNTIPNGFKIEDTSFNTYPRSKSWTTAPRAMEWSNFTLPRVDSSSRRLEILDASRLNENNMDTLFSDEAKKDHKLTDYEEDFRKANFKWVK